MQKAYNNVIKYRAILNRVDENRTREQKNKIYGNIGANKANYKRL